MPRRPRLHRPPRIAPDVLAATALVPARMTTTLAPTVAEHAVMVNRAQRTTTPPLLVQLAVHMQWASK